MLSNQGCITEEKWRELLRGQIFRPEANSREGKVEAFFGAYSEPVGGKIQTAKPFVKVRGQNLRQRSLLKNLGAKFKTAKPSVKVRGKNSRRRSRLKELRGKTEQESQH